MLMPRSGGGALLLAAAMLALLPEPLGAFLQPPCVSPSSGTPHHRPEEAYCSRQRQRVAPLHSSFWQGIQELFNPAATSSSSSSTGGAQGGPGLTPAEEEAKRLRQFRAYEPQDKAPVGPYLLGSEAASLPSMDDLWREAWPTEACKDIMARREAANECVRWIRSMRLLFYLGGYVPASCCCCDACIDPLLIDRTYSINRI